jgi:hypothetical protein
VRSRRWLAFGATTAVALGVAAAAGVAFLARSEPPRASVAVLLEDNTLLLLDRSGDEIRRVRLRNAPKQRTMGRYLVVGAGRIHALLPGDRRDRLAVLDFDGQVVKKATLPLGVRFRALAVGGRTQRVFLAGERETAAANGFGGRAAAAVLVVLSSEGTVVATATLRSPQPHAPRVLDWRIDDLAIAHDERRAFVSYHGPNTGGADMIELADAAPERCSSPARVSCIEDVHGAVEAMPDSLLLATTGTPPRVALFAANGRLGDRWQVGLDNAHLMEFARVGRRVFTVESCTKTGGLSVLDLDRGRARVLHAPAPVAPLRGLPGQAVCGERISAAGTGRVAIVKRGTITGIAGVFLLDVSGQIVRWRRLAVPPVDAVVLSPTQ